VLTAGDWLRIAGVGAVMMAGTVAVLDACYPGGLFTLLAGGAGPNHADEAYARTMAFTTLMMFQLYNAYSSRSTSRSAFAGFLDNGWLHAAVAASLLAHVLVIHVPVLQAAFRTVPLAPGDWLVAAGVAATLLLVTELAKAASRMGGREAASAASASRDRPPAPA
jgi:Ca2+-transporting ATPase